MAVVLPERRKSSVARIFRRGSSLSTKSNKQDEIAPIFNPEDQRRLSLIPSLESKAQKLGLPIKILKSKPQKVDDINEEEELSSSCNLAALFFSLPTELKHQILCELHWKDLLSLRLTSRSLNHLVHSSQSAIVRNYIRTGSSDLNPLYTSLYPPPESSSLTLDYLFGIIHRHHVAEHLSICVTDFISTKIYNADHAPEHWKSFQPKCRRMERKLVPGLFTLFQFFEEYRSMLLKSVSNLPDDYPRPILGHQHNLLRQGEKAILKKYEPEALLQAHQVYRILFSAFTRKLRPPSYAGVLERTLRGWSRAPASRKDMVKVFVFGGLREIKNVMSCPNYNARLKALDAYIVDLYINRNITTPLSQNVDHLSCSVMPPLNERTARKATPSLPDFVGLWGSVAISVMVDKHVMPRAGAVPDIYDYMAQLMEEEEDDVESDEIRIRPNLRVGSLDDDDEVHQEVEGPYGLV